MPIRDLDEFELQAILRKQLSNFKIFESGVALSWTFALKPVDVEMVINVANWPWYVKF